MATKRQRLTGPGTVLDRSAKRGKLKFAFDCSPDAFITECRREKGRLLVTFAADGMEPIEVLAAGKLWAFELQDAAIPAGRLADLEALITEESDVRVTIEYVPAPKLPGMQPDDG